MYVTKSKLAVGGVVLAGAVALTTAGTMAVFTDSDAVGTNEFTAKTISLSTNPTSNIISLTNLMPGDSLIDDVTVTNDAGSGALRYAVKSSATNENPDPKNLKDALSLKIRTKTANPCSSEDGTLLYDGDLDGGAGKIIGDEATGSQAGNAGANPGQTAQGGDRALAAAANEILCFKVALALATGNSYQGATTTATFTFVSEQTANN